jgi:hypothetical protein
MAHLNAEEFEGLLSGQTAEPAHLALCPACRQRLAQERATAARLRAAFESVHADTTLVERIRSQIRASGSTTRSATRKPLAAQPAATLMARIPRWAWAGLAAAAMLALIAIPIFLSLRPSSAMAAQAELVMIHDHNLTAGHEFHGDSDPAKLAEYFRQKLGFVPAMPELDQGMKLRGCCLARFRGEPVGSYVVDTTQGAISIIVTTGPALSCCQPGEISSHGRTMTVASCTCGHCNMASLRLNGYTYFALGDQTVPHDTLVDLLLRLQSPAR